MQLARNCPDTDRAIKYKIQINIGLVRTVSLTRARFHSIQVPSQHHNPQTVKVHVITIMPETIGLHQSVQSVQGLSSDNRGTLEYRTPILSISERLVADKARYPLKPIVSD